MAILWDIVERHLDEAEFLFEQWESALNSPRYTLEELNRRIEQRLFAHIDGLQVAGEAAVEKLLAPALVDSNAPARAVVSALVQILCGECAWPRVLEAVESADDALRVPLRAALILSSEAKLDPLLYDRFSRASAPRDKALWLRVLSGRGINLGSSLLPCLDDEDPGLLQAALEALALFPTRAGAEKVERHLTSGIPIIGQSALNTALTLGINGAWKRCLDAARAPDGFGDALLLVALLGQPGDHQALYQALSDPKRREPALWALGFAGTVEAGDACLEFVGDKNARVARLAANALAWIGGRELEDDDFRVSAHEPTEEETLPPLEEDDLDADLALDGVDELAAPNAQALAQWWKINRSRLAQQGRMVFGRPFSAGALMHALKEGPLWRRHGVALELGIRSRGSSHVSTRTFCARQRRELTVTGEAPLLSAALQIPAGSLVRT